MGMRIFPLLPLVMLLSEFIAANTRAADEAGFVPLFNGRDLSGWVNVNCAPETWAARDGLITCTGKPTGALRTERQYENFIFELEWRHLSSGGNAGIFIWSSPLAAPGVPFLRSIEVQVLDGGYGNTDSHTTHGDVFPIHGSKMKPLGRHRGDRSFPSEMRSKPSPEWNHYRIVADNGVLRLHVNGKEVSGGDDCLWRKGYIGLESEGAPTEWRNLRVKELPATGATAEQSAPEAQGHRSLYTGLDLRGWKSDAPAQWVPSDWRLVHKPGAQSDRVWHEQEFSDCELIFDCKLPGDSKPDAALPRLLFRDARDDASALRLAGLQPGKWGRFSVTAKGRKLTVQLDGREIPGIELPPDAPARRAFGFESGGAVEFANIYIRELK